jgi:phosphopantothenoylcysteine synthetase/decarboxylase
MVSFGAVLISPVEKQLACGEFGMGAMAEVKSIAQQSQVSSL